MIKIMTLTWLTQTANFLLVRECQSQKTPKEASNPKDTVSMPSGSAWIVEELTMLTTILDAINVTLEDLETGIAKHVEKLIFLISFTAIRDIVKKLGKETGSVQIKVVRMLIGAEASTAMKK